MYEHSSIEIDISEYCNLKCAQCTHNAPYFNLSDTPYQLDQFKADIDILSKIIHFRAVRILGGEPLLNRNLVNFLEHLEKSKITEQIVLVTNGLLLDQTPSKVFDLITSLRVNIYSLNAGALEKIKQSVMYLKKSYPNLDIVANRIKYFSKTNTVEKVPSHLVNKIYDKCIARVDGTNLFGGKIYRCYASRRKYAYLKYHAAIVKDNFEYLDDPEFDAISITPNLTDIELLQFLNQPTPPIACLWCLGCSGKQILHQQVKSLKDDVATLADLDFEAGESYLSNCILSWSFHSPDKLKDNPFFKPEHVKDYFKYFTIPPF